MLEARSPSRQCPQVRRRPIPLVPSKSVGGIFSVHLLHEKIARDFRDHARGGDRERTRVAAHQRVAGVAERRDGTPIHQRPVRRRIQPRARGDHRLPRRPQNVHAVHLFRLHPGHAPRDLGIFRQAAIGLFPARRGELFGIVEEGMRERARQNHRRRHHGTGKRPPPRFVNAADADEPARPKLAFEIQRGRRAGTSLLHPFLPESDVRFTRRFS